jgi:hypothetical protein
MGVGLLLSHFIFKVNFWDVLLPRMGNLFIRGLTETNRAYVYEYLMSTFPPFWGYCLGNANLIFSEYIHNIFISSHVSLFVNVWFSLGPIGTGLIAIFFFRPLVSCYRLNIAKNNLLLAALLASFGAWIIAFVGHLEELPLIFAVIYGLFLAQISQLKALKVAIVVRRCSSREIERVGVA